MDSFAMLKDGVSFDRKRFSNDISLFSESLPQKKPKIEAPSTNNIRKEFKIHTSGSNIPEPVSSWGQLFESYSFLQRTQDLITKQYENLTAVQMQAFPLLMQKRDTIAIAPTGSGKTLAYLLPLISLVKNREKLRGLIITPTKELAKQVFKEFLVLSEGTGIVGQLIRKKGKGLEELAEDCDVLFCTPLMLVHMMEEKELPSIEFVIIDESDQLFDMGYLDQVDQILKKCPGGCTKWMFSATMLPAIEMLAFSMLIDPAKITVGIKNATVSTVSQELKFCTNEAGKTIALKQMLQNGELSPPVLVFVQSKDRAIQLGKEIKALVPHTLAIHSGLDDKNREIAVKNFRTGSTWILICTDLMSRGMDFHGVRLVINFDFPQSVISYIHRIGRAGRAGETAKAVTFYTIEDAPYVKMIANVMKKSGFEVPEWMMKLKTPSKEMKKKLEKKPIRRENISSKYRISRSLRKFMKKKRQQSSEDQTEEKI